MFIGGREHFGLKKLTGTPWRYYRLGSRHHNKTSIAWSELHELFGFPVHVKVMFTLYCSLLSVQQHYFEKNNVPTLIKKHC